MILVLDVGNTHIVLGCMEAREMRFKARVATDLQKTEYEYAVLFGALFRAAGIDCADFEGAVISSVVPPLTAILSEAVRFICGKTPLAVGAGIKTGLNIKLENPLELGGDLVASAVGALASYKPPIIIIDMGTATTFSVIDGDGSFIGGAIAPGVALSLNALAAEASLLPRIQLENARCAIGRNTVDSMKSGSILGSAAMLDGMLDRMLAELGTENVTIVATGGVAHHIVPLCRRPIILDEDLLLRGLCRIFEKNRKK